MTRPELHPSRGYLKAYPPPFVEKEGTGEFSLAVNTVQTDNHLGRIVTGKVEHGGIRLGDKIKVLDSEGNQKGGEEKVTKLFYLEGLQRVDVEEAPRGGDCVAGGGNAGVGTQCAHQGRAHL